MDKSQFAAQLNQYSGIKHVIGVCSGKGGVGKSLVTASLANEMAERGYKVGIMDADITGPSIPKMYGIHQNAESDGTNLFPETSENGIAVMSTNLILENEDDPVIWRGPVVANVVKQFWTDVCWGELDYLFVDMPPGTGDVPLTVFQSLPIEGVIIVTSPQDLVKLIVAKAYKMASMMEIPVIGFIENYSYILCPDCGRKISVFGESKIDAISAELNVPVLGKMPIQPEIAKLADEGRFALAKNKFIDDAIAAMPGIKK